MKGVFKGGPYDGQDGVCGDNGMPHECKMPHGKTVSVYKRDPTDPFVAVYSHEEEPKP